ncbi:hypothetical protein TSAR_008127 [Trichomalopsis sarcophagae]|uniref:HAT C-terminal dimerisation domain-containing protein n=1 Tax=Trichomalopsis sarcophagae TaxID=543379 RepID=A0A232EJU6_9HYME|nr:hypothetical protein TSAR_008127 [Trichomalopsis sarcophagae]
MMQERNCFFLPIFLLPHSNAEPERTFSDVNEVKDLKGNKTSTAFLNARCFLRSYNAPYNINSLTFKTPKKQLNMFTTENL